MTERNTPTGNDTDQVRACLHTVCDGVTAAHGDLHALPEHIIQEIENDQDAPLGGTYRRFLEAAGGGAGRFLQGSDVFYPELIGIRRVAQALLAANGLTLEDSDRVILMHQGTQFDFTRGHDDDPEVWSYADGDDEPTKTHPRFTDWLRANVDEQTTAWAHLASWQSLTVSVKNRA